MDKEFVPYEQALDLKELGFDEECLGYFDDRGIFCYASNPWNATKEKGMMFHPTSAPTYWQAFKWFRDKHKLHGYCDYYRDEYWEYYIGDITDNDVDVITKGSFKTYEDAELACIKKLIEIVKEKK